MPDPPRLPPQTFPNNVLPPAGLSHEARQAPAATAWIDESAPPGVLLMPHFLSPEYCAYLCEFAEQQNAIALGIYEGAQSDKRSVISPGRTTSMIDINGKVHEILALFHTVYGHVLAPFFGIDFEWFERPQLLRYPVGGEYRSHADAENWSADQNAWIRALDRDYSVILYLNDDFAGGDLRLINQRCVIRPAPGMLVAFPGDARYLHDVTPTTSGIRYALVSWAATLGTERVQTAPPYGSIFLRKPLNRR